MTHNHPSDGAIIDPEPVAHAVERWFAEAARDLPWRETFGGQRNPYRSLVSEFMLQQTQVARVLEFFEPFLARFPTVGVLAAADEADVLAAWSGLGYYRRARSLHASAKAIVERFGGAVPETTAKLISLPGIGRYTAGSIASLVYKRREPIVDGNITRVLMRLAARAEPQQDKATVVWAWTLATELVEASGDPALCNEGLMELGATVCTPRAPKCGRCPLIDRCRAHAGGRTEDIPPPKPRAKQRELFCASVLAGNARGQVLIEQRPDAGMWAGMIQVPTLERDDRPPNAVEVAAFVRTQGVERIGSFTHQTTHRLVRFVVWRGEGARAGGGRVWKSRQQVGTLALSNAQRRVLGMLESKPKTLPDGRGS